MIFSPQIYLGVDENKFFRYLVKKDANINKDINRRKFLKLAGVTAAGAILSGFTGAFAQEESSTAVKPNFIIIFCDDLGYGDIGCFGSKNHRTPNIDRMATEGMRFTSFYVTSGVCTPSRSSLMTGCYPRRLNMHESDRNECVLFPVARKGLNPNEITIAEVLKTQGYATACVGKWHLGDQPEFLPTSQVSITITASPTAMIWEAASGARIHRCRCLRTQK